MNVKLILLGMLLLLTSACATVGRDYNESNIAQIKVGETTKEQAIALFGQPVSTSSTSSGIEVYSWIRTKAFLGTAKTKTLSITFKDGKVESFTQAGSALP